MASEGYPTDNAGTTASLGFGFDSMGRMYSVTDQLASQQIIQSATYGPANELTQIAGAVSNGSWGTETRTYNAMKQLTQLASTPYGLGTVISNYNYSPTQNNGKIVSDSNGSYTYDSVNRIATATGSGWNQTYTYDGFGNLSSIAGTQANTITYNPATNQGYCADANGNSTEVGCAGGYNGYTYDIENRIVVTGSGAGNFHYGYAPGNKRVWRGDGGTTDELTFWSPGGQKLGTYALTATAQTYSNGRYVGPFFYATQTDANYYFGSKLIKNSRGWVFSDRLGSVGKYLPYGQDNGSGNPTNGSEKFTGYQRDAETGLDYADQRYESPGTGRCLTSDRTNGTPANPGSWNKYSYTEGDPIGRVDPGGTSGVQDCIEDGDCENYFNDPLFALTIETASLDPNSPCAGQSFSAPSAECLAFLWPGLFALQQTHPQLMCSFVGYTTQKPGFGAAADRNKNQYGAPIIFNFSASGGDGSYTWSDVQTVSESGYITYDNGLGFPDLTLNPVPNESLDPPQGQANTGPNASFGDAPGLGRTATYPGYGLSTVQSAHINFSFSLTVTVSSGGQTVTCPVVSWSATLDWQGSGRRAKVKETDSVQTRPTP